MFFPEISKISCIFTKISGKSTPEAVLMNTPGPLYFPS